MDSGEDCDEIRRAIALSLKEISRPPPNVSKDGNEEEERFQAELQRALDASKAEASENAKPTHPSRTQQASEHGSAQPSFISERAQMEKARIERLKRLRKDADLDGGGEVEMVQPPSKKQYIPSSSGVRANGISSAASSSSATTTSHAAPNVPTIDRLFWNGELRQTAVKHAEPRRDGKPNFRLTDLLGKKSDLAFAILSSYSLMLSWIYEFFDPSVPVVLVAQPDQSGEAGIKQVLPNWIRTVPFLRNGRGCMHMKFMLLFYKTGRLRVVISTANLVDFDYRDIENTVWLQDIPLRPSPIPHDPKAVDDFPAVFQRVLRALNVTPALTTLIKTDHPNIPLKSIEELRTRWDWSKVKAQLVPSIAGKHDGWANVILTGHPRLMKAVRSIGMRTARGKELVLECQGSSIGTYSTQWMNEFHTSARGDSAEDWLDGPKARRTKLPWPPVKIVFPTLQTVKQSALGEPGGGTIFCRRNQWDGAKFPRELFYDSKSTAGAVLMHSKMIIAISRDKPALSGTSKRKQAPITDNDSDTEDDDVVEVVEEAVGWMYVGSHNFTPSAWGTLSGSSFSPTLNITNYELGLLFPLKDEQAAQTVACWERPPKKYDLGNDKPWIQEESAVLQAH